LSLDVLLHVNAPQKAKTFERTVEALFGLTPRDGSSEDKFKLALENISKHDE
jgi:hypothetical protein